MPLTLTLVLIRLAIIALAGYGLYLAGQVIAERLQAVAAALPAF